MVPALGPRILPACSSGAAQALGMLRGHSGGCLRLCAPKCAPKRAPLCSWCWQMNGSEIKNDDGVVNSAPLRLQLWHCVLRLFSLRLGVGFPNFYAKLIFFCKHTVKYSEFEPGLLETEVHVGIAGDVLGLLLSVSPWKCQ